MTQATLTVSFGTSHEDMRARAIDPIEADIARAFPQRTAYTAWTSGMVVAKVCEERGEHHDTLDAALERLASAGVDDVIVQPTCLQKGHEMRKIESTLQTWKHPATVRLGAPLLSSPDDRRTLARILVDEFSTLPESEMLVLMGHGSKKGGNQVYDQMNDAFAALGKSHFFVATVEGQPSFADALDLVEERQPTLVHLTPLMIVAGDHAVVDMVGSGNESWKSQLEARGYTVSAVSRGLGEYEAVRQLVVQHAHDAQPLERTPEKA